MAKISKAQAYAYAAQAGFGGGALDTVVAIAQAESGLDVAATSPAGDRGIVQINAYWHSEVPNSCAFDPACAFREAYRISSHGTNFNPWVTYLNGSYKKFLPSVAGAPSKSNGWLQVLQNLPPHQPCSVVWRRTCPGGIAAYEGGMDLNSAKGIPVYALGSGSVIGAGYFYHPNGNPGYGVVTIRTQMPDGSTQDVYYQHITISQNIKLCSQTGGQLYNGVVGPPATFQSIRVNQLIGWVSDSGEVEVGINADWSGVWGVGHPGAWVNDPEDMVRQLMAAGGGTGSSIDFKTGLPYLDEFLKTGYGNATAAVSAVTTIPGIEGAISVFDDAQQFWPFQIPDDTGTFANWPIVGGFEQSVTYPVRLALGIFNFIASNFMAFVIRSFFLMIALVVILALLINITSHQIEEHPELAEAALL